ncbi:MAG: hypothetical protein CMI67_26055 [Pelagibaca sp.]|nr:hypothetical protein [Pelagibaca sp.]|tara:strand:- start:1060 stop:1788 length:729 start_codon:yes stop_codon:yes gene_type:complete
MAEDRKGKKSEITIRGNVLIALIALFAVIYLAGDDVSKISAEDPLIGNSGSEETTWSRRGDVALSRTALRPIVYNETRSMPLEQPTRLTLKIGSGTRAQLMRRTMGLPGTLRGDEALLTERVEASLTSSRKSVELQPIGSMEATLRSDRDTTFEWWVTPTTTAKFVLTLKLYNVATTVDGRHSDPIETWDQEITVNSTLKQKISALWEGFKEEILGVIATLIAVGVGWLTLRSKLKPGGDPS